jgi:ATP-binding protein involved in chromosome partitioning
MAATRDQILSTLKQVTLPDGGDLVSRDMVRALSIDEGTVRFVIEAETPEAATRMEDVRKAAEAAVEALTEVEKASVVLTAHGAAGKAPPKAIASASAETVRRVCA